MTQLEFLQEISAIGEEYQRGDTTWEEYGLEIAAAEKQYRAEYVSPSEY